MVIVSENACSPLKAWLSEHEVETRFVRGTSLVYPAIAAHADIYYCEIDGTAIEYTPDELSYEYPGDCAFNGVSLSRYFIHNKKCTAPRLMEIVKAHGKQYIDVKQGYTKCSVAVVDGKSIITSDEGICRALSEYDISCLRICPGSVELPGMDCGFFGGTCGRVGEFMLFNGDVSAHPDFTAIRDFLEMRGVVPVWFGGEPLTDIGSIIECHCLRSFSRDL